MAIREGAWDCPSCGRKGNRGPEKHCPGCGAPRGSDVPFYLPDAAAEVTDEAALARAKAGPDWTCSYCGGDNPAGYDFCSGCGAGKDGSPPRPVVEHRTAPAAPEAAGVSAGRPAASRPSRSAARVLKLGCLGALALAALVLFLGRPRAATLTVEGFAWERTVEVERFETAREEGWEGELPAGARELSRSREVHHEERIQTGTERRTRTVSERVQTGTERVKVGVRDLGNGYFEDVYEDRPVYETRERREAYDEPVYRTEPVYRQRIRYEIDRWKPLRTERAAGQDRSPTWPPSRLARGEREGRRGEAYTVVFRDQRGREIAHPAASEAEWRRFEPGRAFRAKVQGGKVRAFLDPP